MDERTVVKFIYLKNAAVNHVYAARRRCDHKEICRERIGIYGDKPLGRREGKEENEEQWPATHKRIWRFAFKAGAHKNQERDILMCGASSSENHGHP